MKPIVLSVHASESAAMRGATRDEVIQSVQEGEWQSARRGRFRSKVCFPFNAVSPLNGKQYRWKTVEAVFAEDSEEILVVTVLVYYGEEVDP